MKERIEKIKTHLKENKAAYISGVLCGVSGLIAGYRASSDADSIVNVNPKQILAWKSTQTIEVIIEALGDPGNIVQDTTTGTVYASQGQAARALGVDASTVSKHLNGVLPNVRGHVLTKLGKAAVGE